MIDLGTVRGPWGESHFVEGVGTGLIPLGIQTFEAEPSRKDESVTERARAASRYLDVLRSIHPKPIALTGDGLRLEHDVLLVEVLNIRSVGPNLVLSSAADPSDGFLTLVVAGPEHRDTLSHFLQCRVEGRRCRLTLPTWQVRWLVMSGCTELHVDDVVHEWPSSQSVSVCMGPSSVPVLM
jgi:diacylglycerol kinase family enzyme